MDTNLDLFKQRQEREAAKKAAEVAQDLDELAFTNATELKYTMRGSTQAQMMEASAKEYTLDQPFKLFYFPVESRAGAIRLMLAHGNVQYEDCRITMEEWGKGELKPHMPNGQMPALMWEDGHVMGESLEIAITIAKHCGYYQGEEDLAFAKSMWAQMSKWYAIIFMPTDFDTQLKEVLELTVPEFIATIEAQLAKSGGKWLMGDKLSLADFWAGSYFVNNVTNPNCPYSAGCKALVEAAPAFKAWGEAFASENKAYLEMRPAGLPL
jgi:prostaglandin-H2 D-isomerase / glutathione transferase